MDQQPGRRKPTRGQGRGPGAGEEFAEEQPNVVRPFVRHNEQAQRNQREQQEQQSQRERTNLVPTPLPAPRAVARQIRPGEHAPLPPPRPMSDLTTTMPILVVPDLPGDGDHNAPPGEPGHFHDDGDFGRHRDSGRSPRLKAAGILVGVVVAGVAVAGTFAGGSGKSGSTPQAGGGAATAGIAPTSDSAVPDTPSDSAADGAPSASKHSPTPTPTRSTRTPSPKPSTSTKTAPGANQAMASRPSSASAVPSTAPSSTPPTTPTTSASPAFTALRPGDSGPAVTKLQSDLTTAGYGLRFRKGYYDGLTETAVTDFQVDHPGTAQADGWGNYGAATDKALQAAVSEAGG